MAVTRGSQPLQINSGQGVSLRGSGIGNVAPDFNKFATAPDTAPVQQSSMSSILNTIVGAGSKLMEKEISVSQEEQYLKGAAAAASGQAEADLQTNFLTANFQKAGYRDTRGRLLAADTNAQIAANMVQYREQSPQQFAKMLSEKRAELAPSWEGMSLDARKGMLTQQLATERSLIQKHATEHVKFIVDQQSKAVSANVSSQFDMLDMSKTDLENYQKQTTAAFASVYSNIWSNPNLPTDVRRKLTMDAMVAAQSRDHQLLYNQFKNTTVDINNPDGTVTKATMFSQLDFDDQVKLGSAYRESMGRTKVDRSSAFEDQMAVKSATWHNPNAPLEDPTTVRAFLDQAQQQGLLEPGKRESVMKDYWTAAVKKQGAATLAQAYISGDSQVMFSLGKSSDDGLDAYVHTMSMSGKPVGEVISNLMTIGQNTGQGNAFKKVGELTKAAINSLGTTDKIDPGNAGMIRTVMSRLQEAETTRPGAVAQYMSAFSEDDRAKVAHIRDQLQKGVNPVQAMQNAVSIQQSEAQLDPKMRTAMGMSHAAENAKVLADLTPQGIFGMMGGKIASWFSSDAANRQKLRTGHSWFENEDRVNERMAGTKLQLAGELSRISAMNPMLSADARISMALANVANRTVQTEAGGPLTLNPLGTGQTVQQVFGVPPSTNPGSIGEALDSMFKPGKGNSAAYKALPSGQIGYTELNDKGQIVRTQMFDPKSVSTEVDRLSRVKQDKLNALMGDGVTVKGNTGVAVNFNGRNTSSIANELAFQIRKDLVLTEGVRDTPYEDSSGKVVDGKRVMTSGVGVSSHSPFYEAPDDNGKHSQAQINRMFMRASDSAISAGVAVGDRAGVRNDNAVRLFSQIAYQGGNNFAAQKYFKPFMDAVRAKDAEAAKTAFKDTPVWKMSHQERQGLYLSLIDKALEK